MKTVKRFRTIGALVVASLLVSFCLLCFCSLNLIKGYAEEVPDTANSTPITSESLESLESLETDSTESVVVEDDIEQSIPENELNSSNKTEAEITADEINEVVKNWFGAVFGASSTILDIILLAMISAKKKQPVTVTVNDADTQQKLNAIQVENANLRQILVDTFKLQKGTFELIKTVFAKSTSLDDTAKNAIKQIALHEEDIIKDFEDICNSETHKKVKTSLKNISNIILG